MSRRGVRVTALATGLCLAVACGGHTKKSVAENPRPNLDLQPTGRSLGLRIAPEVEDAFRATGTGIRPIRVAEWRQTLKNGFANAFGGAFALVAEGEPADLTIEVAEAELRTESAAVSGYYGVVAIRAVVRYKVRLLGRNGEVLYRLAGEAGSKGAITSVFQFRQAVKDAAETFWETVGQKYFLLPWPQNPAIPGTPMPGQDPATHTSI
jgi:hypothetical protein